MSERVRPFSSGSQFGDWTERNCERCKKSSEDGSKCDLELALCMAYFGDGTISREEAGRIGCDKSKRLYTWDCTERELNEDA